MRIPGVLYSLLLAVGAWAVEYFTTGSGGDIPWSPILVAAIPVILKSFSVMAEPQPLQPTGSTRSLSMDGGETVAQRNSVRSWLLG